MAMLWFLILSIGTLLALYAQTEAQINSVSPCPGLFVYEGGTSEPDRWYGVVILLSDVDLSSVWLRLIFDRPSLQLGNWFGQVETTDNKEYIIKNREAALKANKPQPVRFFIRYDTSEPPPRLLSFRLNARTVCSADSTTDVPSVEPYTSPSEGDRGGGAGEGEGGEVTRPEGGFNVIGPPSSTEDYFPGDFSFFNRSQLDPIGHENLNEICGTVAAKPRPFITFGEESREGEYPWYAALYQAKIDLMYICAASLISKYHVLTVAHCVTRKKSTVLLSPDSLIVYLGKHYLKRFSNAGIQQRQVSEIFPYPQYDPQTFRNDIALVKFTAPADITDYVRPVCLWQESTDLSTVLNKLGSVIGWNILEDTGAATKELVEAKIPVVSQETCLYSFPDFYSRYTSSKTYCAGFRNGTSVCKGTSGSGMVFPKPNSNPKNPRWQIRGLVSISVALMNQEECDSSNYVVFTDSAKYLDWIRKTMQK